jgi:phosphomannomutase
MDIEFGTDGWRTTVEEFTTPRIRAVGQAVADYLRAESERETIAIGYDPREGSRPAAEELARVVSANGFDVRIADRDTPTPVVAWTVKDRALAGALQVTASHNPPTYNGIKFVPGDGAPALPEVTDQLAARLKPPEPSPEAEWGTITETDFIEPYLDHALSFVATDLDGLAIAHDAMHGSGRGVTDELLARAGADVTRLRATEDPEFGGSPPEPTAEHLAELEQTVVEGDADLGIANDGDSDRLAAVTPDRGVVNPNPLFAALYEYLLETDGGDVVRTVSTTALVDRIAESAGRTARETAVGFKWVADAMDEDTLIGGEESGGFGLTAHLRNKDGVVVALVVAAADEAEPLDDRLDRIRTEYGDIVQDRRSIDCPDEHKTDVLDRLDEALPDRVAGTAVDRVDRTDGFKLFLVDGSWLLVRPSGTEPKLRIYAEAASKGRTDALLAAGESLLRNHIP